MVDVPNKEQERVRRSLRELASKVPPEVRSRRAGDVVLRLTGKGGGTYRVLPHGQDVEVSETADLAATPLIEVMGDAEAVKAILDGNVDAREQFLAGGLRVRGDLQYLSDVAVELGLLKHPL